MNRVMEEAGDKIELNIDEIKSNYSQRLVKLDSIIKKVDNEYFINESQFSIFNRI